MDLDPAARLVDPETSIPTSRQETIRMMWIYMVYLFTLLDHRQFFISQKGYIGLAPAIAEAGDTIAIIAGSETPFILRPNPGGENFTLIGEAYTHGFMYGEIDNFDHREELLENLAMINII